eukprot:1061977-Pyramimonas_sp.AAC.1
MESRPSQGRSSIAQYVGAAVGRACRRSCRHWPCPIFARNPRARRWFRAVRGRPRPGCGEQSHCPRSTSVTTLPLTASAG